jgi:DNA-directed RNA polymerase specialized sigma24 family protein
MCRRRRREIVTIDGLRRLRRVAFVMTGSRRVGDDALREFLRQQDAFAAGEAPSPASRLAGLIPWLERIDHFCEPSPELSRLHLHLLAQPFRARAAVVLRLVDGLSLTSAAEILGCRTDEVQALVTAVRLELRSSLLIEPA